MQSGMGRHVIRSLSWDCVVSYIAFLEFAWPQVKSKTSSKEVGGDIGVWCRGAAGVIEQTKSSFSGDGQCFSWSL